MARMYPKSQKLAEVEVSVQKDTWHIERWGSQVRHNLEHKTLAALRKVYKLEDQLLEGWKDILFFDQYIPAVAKRACRTCGFDHGELLYEGEFSPTQDICREPAYLDG